MQKTIIFRCRTKIIFLGYFLAEIWKLLLYLKSARSDLSKMNFNEYSEFGLKSAFSKGLESSFSEGPGLGSGPGPLYKLWFEKAYSTIDKKETIGSNIGALGYCEK